MSLGSKELYHSNVWAWIISLDKEKFVKMLLPNDDQIVAVDSVLREQDHRDLTIWVKLKDASSKCIVIENKLKSIPTVDQLNKYAEKLGKYYYKGFLTGLKRPIIVDNCNMVHTEHGDWNFLSYNDFSGILEKFVKEIASKISNQTKVIISEYLDNNRYVEELVNMNIKNNRLEQNFDSELDDLGLRDLINKINGSNFVSYVANRLEKDGIKIKFYYSCSGFHNKKFTLDFRLSNWSDYNDKKTAKKYFNIGIQIEGYQYRRIVDTNIFSSKKEIFDHFADYEFLDPNYIKEKGINFPNDIIADIRPSKMINTFDKYGDNCIYQYSDLDKDGLDYEIIYQRIKNDILLTEKIVKKIIKEYNIY